MDWLNVWFSGGYEFIHSIDDVDVEDEIIGRLDAMLSHVMKMKNHVEIIEREAPIEEITFHDVKASG